MPHHLAKMIPRRWPSYVSALSCAFFLGFLGLNAPDNDAHLSTFGTLSLITATYIFVLLCYGRSEAEYKHTLTRCITHIASFCVIGVLWLGIGTFFAIRAEMECRHHTPVCVFLQFSSVLAFFIFLSSCLCIAIVMCPVAVAGGGYNTHVEDARERARNSAINRQQAETGETSFDHGMSLINLQSPPRAHAY